MKDVKVNIKLAVFPSQFVSDAEKETMEYGLQIGQAIQYEWFRRDGVSCRFYDQFRQFHRLRLYARGEQSVAKYKNELAVDGDLSYLNLDWTPVPVIPKFVDIVVNGMSDRLFKVKAYAQDAMSQSKRSKYQDMVEAQMVSKDFLLDLQQQSGFDPFTVSPEQLPQTDEELSLYMQINYKPSIEIAEDDLDQAWKDLSEHNINSNDFVIGIAASGTTPYVIGALEKCNENGIVTGCITCNKNSPLGKVAQFPVEVVVGPEFVTGSSRMKAGTAQKLVLNMISTATMIQLGKVKGNKMVDMQLSNNKLVDRGQKMLMNELNIDLPTAIGLLDKHGSVRQAIKMYQNEH